MTTDPAWWCPTCHIEPTWPAWDPDTGRPVPRRCNECQQAADLADELARTHEEPR